MSLLSKLFHFVLITTNKYGIDESHGLSHSMNVLHYANKIYENEVTSYPILKNQEKLIYVSAILHDMCDKKYVDENSALKEIEIFLQAEHALTPVEINMSKQIMSTMSYSKVKEFGFPIMGGYQKAYHVVREADLLTAYDFDRCMIYNMNKNGVTIDEAFENARELFNKRVLLHNEHELFQFEYSKKESQILHIIALQRINFWKKMIHKKNFIK
jgi:HD superfamily phosphodiesterase